MLWLLKRVIARTGGTLNEDDEDDHDDNDDTDENDDAYSNR